MKYTIALKLIEKSLQQAAERSGMSTEELEDISVDGYGLDQQGGRKIMLGDATAHLQLATDGSVSVSWRNADGKLREVAPAAREKGLWRKRFAGSYRSAKEIEQASPAQRCRLESSFLAAREIPFGHWRQYYVEHPLLGFFGAQADLGV